MFFLKLILGRATVKGVMGHFHKAIAELEAVRDAQARRAAKKKEQADKAIAARVAALGEMADAEATIGKLRDLVPSMPRAAEEHY
jgi:hypothetical protein